MDMARLFNFFKQPQSQTTTHQNKQPQSFYRSIYPESVRYAFQYKGAQMGKAEMKALLERYTHEVVYLVTKALAFDREYQRQFLETLTRLYVQADWQKSDLQAVLCHYIDLLPADMTVAGTKLAQISRSGSGEWQRAWRELVQQLFDENPQALPCLIAHTPIFAYHEFIAVYKHRRNAKLIFLMPDWMMDDNETQMGYEITLSDIPTVNLQVKDECLVGSWMCLGVDCKLKKRFCTEAIFIDDTINTSATAGKLRSFWLTKYGLNMPVERVRVITDLRGNLSAIKHQA